MSAPVRILVVEDSATQAEALRALLQEQGYHPVLARSGEEALARLAAEPVSLVVSDVMMPGMDGYELCRRIRTTPAVAALPVILLTTLSDPLDIGQALAEGATNYVMKPYPPAVLLARIRSALEPRSEAAAALEIAGVPFRVAGDSRRILDVLAASLEDLARINARLQAAEAERAAQLGREHRLRAAAEQAMREKSESLARLEASEARFRGLAASSILGVIAARGEIVTDANAGFLELVGARPDDVSAGRLDLRRLTPPEYLDRDERARREMLDRGRALPYEKEFLRADGGRVPALVGGALVSREPYEWVAFVIDMSARRRTEEQLRHAQRIAAVGRLAGGVAHEINNMMTVVIGIGTFVLRNLGEDHRESGDVREMVKAATRASRVSQQLLAYTRQQVFQLSRLDLNAVIADGERIVRQALGTDRELDLRLAPDLPPIRGDRDQLQQVLVNLALNARDATEPGGRMTLATSALQLDRLYAQAHPGAEVRQGPYVLLQVSDSGHGMDAATLAHAFDPFFTTKPVGHGTGLGLSTVYGIVKQSEGYVWIYSEPGQGTTVKIYLPVAQQEAPVAAPAPPPSGESVVGGSERVLVVEDEDMVRTLTRRGLAELGYAVREAADGPAALALLEADPGGVDLVLCDVVMPGMSGAELGRRVATLRPELPVIYMSGHTGEDVVQRGLLPPEAPFLAKPFTEQGLALAVRRHLDARTAD